MGNTRRLTEDDIPQILELHRARAAKTKNLWPEESSISTFFKPKYKSFNEYRIYGEFCNKTLVATIGCNMWSDNVSMNVHTLLTHPEYNTRMGKNAYVLLTKECEKLGYYDQYSSRRAKWMNLHKRTMKYYGWICDDPVFNRYELIEIGRVPANTKPKEPDWWKMMTATTMPYDQAIVCFRLKDEYRK